MVLGGSIIFMNKPCILLIGDGFFRKSKYTVQKRNDTLLITVLFCIGILFILASFVDFQDQKFNQYSAQIDSLQKT